MCGDFRHRRRPSKQVDVYGDISQKAEDADGREVRLIHSFMSWIGGKKALRGIIVRMFPLCYERYIEVFGGGGWVLFHKHPGEDFEIYNDLNNLLTNLYRCVRDRPEELTDRLRYVLNARADFERVKEILADGGPADAVTKAAMFYQLIRYSYAAGLRSYAGQPHDIRINFPLIEQAHRRLGKVVIENQDFERLIRHYDRPESFFYCDPPYYETEGYYANVGEGDFDESDHIRLRDTLFAIEGKFLLSYNDSAFVRALYDVPGIVIRSISRLNNLRQRYESGSQFEELLIANYDMDERRQAGAIQMSLFGDDERREG
jgi:DNA adenine methylase